MCDSMQSVGEQLAEIENELKSCKNSTDDYDYTGITLMDMPVEIILKICSFLDPVFLKYTLRLVCQRLEDILSDDMLWKNWIHSRIKGHFPVIPQLAIYEDKPINWERVCIEMDIEFSRWYNVKESMKHVVVKDMHYASVDTVLLVNKGELCISGSRDRSMALLNISDVVSSIEEYTDPTFCEGKPLKMKHDAHSGWVWDLAPDNEESATIVYSASWDNSVKAWDLETFECLENFGCGMSVLSLVGNGKEVMAGLYAKKVLIFDQRSGTNAIQTYKAHNGAVLDICKSDNLIASISDDKTMTIFDRAAGKILKSDIKVTSHDSKAYPVCLSWSSAALYVGDSRGYLTLFNPEDHAHKRSFELWEQPPITNPQIKTKCCYQSEGIMIVCSDRGEIKFFYNNYPPTEFTSIGSSTIDITELHYQNDVLAISTCDSALEFWIPHDRYEKTCP